MGKGSNLKAFVLLYLCVWLTGACMGTGDPNFSGTGYAGYAEQTAAGASPLITFNEFPPGTHISTHYADLGIFFSGDDPFITGDSDNPTSPVLSGTPKFNGIIEGCFIVPQNPDPNTCDPNLIAAVSWFSLDAGFFNETGTTHLEWFDYQGAKLGEVYNSVTGIEHFVIEGIGIASWRIGMVGGDTNGYAIDNIDFEPAPLVEFWKEDGNPDCVSESNEIVYQICFNFISGQSIEDAYIVDWLNDWVDYPAGEAQLSFDPNEDPPFMMLPPDPYYTPRPEHCYTWFLGDISPNDSGCVNLTVVVNDQAVPGEYLHNVAELYGVVLVPSPSDPNILIPETRLIASAYVDTLVCCDPDQITTLHVDKSAVSGSNSGLDWPNAFTDLQSALERALNTTCGQIDTILVAEGTYVPGQTEDSTFALSENLALYGGYKSGGSDRNPARYQTILTGTLDPNALTRVDTVVTMADETLLDGFTITSGGEYNISGSGVDFSIINSTIEKSEDRGIRATNGNIDLQWCTIRDNDSDGVFHQGSGFTLNCENCWIRKNKGRGLYCSSSTPIVINSIVTESDLGQFGNAGIQMFNPASQPVLYNLTIAHNKSFGIAQAGGPLPDIKNSIVYHNGGPALAGFSADQAASYCCIEDCNSVNSNISVDPEFVYFAPNNVRIMSDSPCHDSGLTLQESYAQVDMDSRTRVLGTAVDRGAYEIECEDTSNSFDTNHDGLLNYAEFNAFSQAWLSRDPNDPSLPSDPNFIDPNDFTNWNPSCDLNGDYTVNLPDIITFIDDAPWCWQACWLTEETYMEMLISGGSEQQMVMQDVGLAVPSAVIPAQAGIQLDESAVQPVTDQLAQLTKSIVLLEQIWLEAPDIRQEIDLEDWNEFMDTLYQQLVDLYMESD
jgi:hypothetical protein